MTVGISQHGDGTMTPPNPSNLRCMCGHGRDRHGDRCTIEGCGCHAWTDPTPAPVSTLPARTDRGKRTVGVSSCTKNGAAAKAAAQAADRDVLVLAVCALIDRLETDRPDLVDWAGGILGWEPA